MSVSDSAGRHIVVVESDHELRSLLEALLADEGWVVTSCASDDEAMACIEQAQPDLVILDVWFYGAGDSRDLLRELRVHPDFSTIPLLVCSDVPIERLDECLNHTTETALAYLEKPFELDAFYATVRRLLHRGGDVSRTDTESGSGIEAAQ